MFWLYVGIGIVALFVICKIIDGRRPVDRRRLGRSIKNTEIEVSQYDNDLTGRSPF
ncbi:hypothetical protein [Nocardioides sp. SR21]|uniref:hypothetical protein n=1 Tax=Nocardioides sp. SR21 TaxID=2919501 RepID=UPI001FA9BC99|nr:hypothetical protein [Nocardioides sp. SR21]